MEDPAVVDEKVRRLRELTSNVDNVFFNIKSERHSFYQALLSLGDRRVEDLATHLNAVLGREALSLGLVAVVGRVDAPIPGVGHGEPAAALRAD